MLVMLDRLDRVDCDAAARWVAALQQPDGSFAGDEWREIDTRFSYCAISCLSLLGKLDLIDVDAVSRPFCRNAFSQSTR